MICTYELKEIDEVEAWNGWHQIGTNRGLF